MTTLLVTNDFPPRPGGIQQYVHNLLVRLDGVDVTVLTSRWGGWEAFDAAQPFEVVRAPTTMLLPTPSAHGRRTAASGSEGSEVHFRRTRNEAKASVCLPMRNGIGHARVIRQRGVHREMDPAVGPSKLRSGDEHC